MSVSILEEKYLVGINACKHNLHGHVICPKGSSLLTVATLRNKLTLLWNKLGRWGDYVAWEGFYELSFSFLEDAKRAIYNGEVGHSLDSYRKITKEPLNNALGAKKKPTQIYVQALAENNIGDETNTVDLEDSLLEPPGFTIIRSKNKKKKVKMTSVYITRSKLHLKYVILSIGEQHIVFTSTFENKGFGFFGDFNVVMGAHEHLGASSLARLHIQNFQDWTDANDLLHLTTIRAYYTWCNGRMGSVNTSKRLDKATLTWIGFLFSTKFLVVLLPKITLIKSATKNIYALIIDVSLVSNQEILSTHVVDHFKNLFPSPVRNTIDYDLIKDNIHTLINQDINQRLTGIPYDIEIEEFIFNLNKYGAPGPNCFGVFFFQHFWDIIPQDSVMAVKQFFISSWIMPNYNVNTLIFLPKVPNDDSIEIFRPIALDNFKF
ncbi:hypothetical protein KIW84_010507 [Lathyrus oleraceus]|uniref:Uncharacterized protein n=1 Tax=Pisum sativum TaxID=3888 RepID=A0A9D5BE37_PEA|nr:hypothetical protein KIW84_010507 [Pisum sativum]